jgi:hypothetical protein
MVPKETGKEVVVEDEDGNNKVETEIQYVKAKLDFDQQLALRNIDLSKEELVNIYRHKGTNGNYRYDLSTEKEGKMHDDRAYCLAMLGWYLQKVRRELVTNKPKAKVDITKYMFHN